MGSYTQSKILIVGEFSPGALGLSYERALKSVGADVLRFDISVESNNLFWIAKNRIVYRLAIDSIYLRSFFSKKINQNLIELSSSYKPDWVFLNNGEWIMPETIQALKSKGFKVAIFHADNPFPPNYNNRPETLKSAIQADLYLIWSFGLVEKLKRFGIANVEFMPFGWDELNHPYQENIKQGEWPGVIFVGGWDREREDFLEELSSDVPVKIYGPSYWGHRTRRKSRVRSSWLGKSLTLNESALAIRQSAISLNILRTQHVVDGYNDGVIMRHFEVPGAGGFLLSTRSSTATNLFPEDETGVYFSDLDECLRKCNYYLNNESERLKLVAATHNLVATKYTYKDCAIKLLNIMSQIS